MGGKVSVKVDHEVDSPTSPGVKSCLTEPLDQYCTYDALFDQVLLVLKDPLLPMENWLLKSITITDDGPEEFQVKVIHDARKLETFGWGKEDGTDRVRSWVKVRHSRSERYIVTEEYHEDGMMEVRCTTKFLEDPLRIEFWGEHRSGTRRCGKIYASVVKHMFIMPSIKCLAKRKVRVTSGVQAVDGHGISCISGPLDEFTSYFGVMDLLLDVLKWPAKKANLEINEISDREFETKTPGPPRKMPVDGEPVDRVTLTSLYRHDYDKGQINAVVSVGNQLLHTAWIKIHRDPLRLEYWIEEGGTRLAGRMECLMLQDIVDSVVKRAEGMDGWFF